MTGLKIAFCCLLPICTYSQQPVVTSMNKSVNYDRKRVFNDNIMGECYTKKYISIKGDTLERLICKSSATGELLFESSYLKGKKNGLEIAYHTNGVIDELDYYFDGKLWEVVSKADSTGKLLNPGTLRDGNGIKLTYGAYGLDATGYMTYKNGVPEGPFYHALDLYTVVKGNLTYKPAVVNYLPAKKVSFVNSKGDSTTDVFETGVYNAYFSDSSGTGLKALVIRDDSVQQLAQTFPYISIEFNDPAVIPQGTWLVINPKNDKQIEKICYDDCGNVINVTIYKDDGSVFTQRQFSPCNKRKIVKYNMDGSLYGEVCIDTMMDILK